MKEQQLQWFDGDRWPEGAQVPVGHIFEATNGWFFVDEADSACLGPFESRLEALKALKEYARIL